MKRWIMPQIDRKTLERSLLTKGFRKGNSDHRVFYYYHDGRQTAIRTKTSHGSDQKTIDGNLLGLIKRQMRLDSSQQLVSFANCTMTAEEYKSVLEEKHLLT